MAKITFTPPKAANPYAEEVAELFALGVPTPEGEAWAFTPVEGDSEGTARNKIGQAARDSGFTARFRGKTDDGSLIYTARPLDADRARKGDEAESSAPVVEDAPVKRGK